MALQRQEAEFPLVAGPNQKRHKHRNLIPSLDTLKNVDLSEPGAVKKRLGYNIAATTRTDGGTVPSEIYRVDRVGERALVWGDNGLFEFARDSSVGKLSPLIEPAQVFASVDSDVFPDPLYNYSRPVYCYANGYEAVATSNTGTIVVYVRNTTTDAIVFTDTITADNVPVRALALSNYLCVFYVDTGTLKLWRWNTASPPTSVTPTTLASDVNGSTRLIDVAPIVGTTTFALVGYTTTTPTISLRKIEFSGATINNSAVTFDTIVADAGMAVYGTTSGYVCAYANTTSGLKIQGITTALATDSAHTLDAGATGNKYIALSQAYSASTVAVYYGDQQDITIDACNLDGSSLAYTARTIAGDGTLQTTAWYMSSSVLYVNDSAFMFAGYGSTLQDGTNTQLLIRVGWSSSTDTACEPLGAVRGSAEAYPQTTTHALCPFVAGPSGYRCLVPGILLHNTTAGTPESQTTLMLLAKVDLYGGKSVDSSIGLVCPGNGFLNGGRLQQVGFSYPPQIISVTGNNGSGALTSSGAYSWVAVYEYVDASGALHQSIPSTPVTATLGASDNEAAVVVNAPFPRTDVSVYTALYRTEDGGTVHYRVKSSSGATVTSAGTVSLTDIASDADAATSTILYSDSGILDAYPPPPTGKMVLHNNRLWCIAENGDPWASRELVAGEGPAWSPSVVVSGSGRTVKPVAIASGGDGGPLIVFYPKRIGLIYGDGPNDRGESGEFSQIQFIEGIEAGTSNHRSVVNTPEGVMFQDDDTGFWILPTGASVPINIGSNIIDDTVNDAIAAHVVPDRKEVRFFGVPQNEGFLVYHYDPELKDATGRGPWSVSELQNLSSATIVDAVLENNRTLLALSSGALWQERQYGSGASHKDSNSGTWVPMTLRTGYIPLSLLENVKRIWDLYILGETSGGQIDFTITVEYDRGGNNSDDYDWSETTSGEMEIRCHLAHQQVQVIRVQIVDLDTSVGSIANLTNLRVEYGISPRGRRPVAVGSSGSGGG